MFQLFFPWNPRYFLMVTNIADVKQNKKKSIKRSSSSRLTVFSFILMVNFF